MPTLDEIWSRIDEAIEPFDGYKASLKKLATLPAGYTYVFALNYADADIRNGGIYQLYQNSTWPLIFDAHVGAGALGLRDLGEALRQIIFYYHRTGRSRLKKRIPPGYFDDLPSDWKLSLDELEDRYYNAFGRAPGETWYRDLREVLSPAIEQHAGLFEEVGAAS